MKRITLEEIEKNGKFETYEALYRHILSEISSGRLSPVKAPVSTERNRRFICGTGSRRRKKITGG